MNKFIEVTRLDYEPAETWINLRHIIKFVPCDKEGTIITVTEITRNGTSQQYKVKETFDEIWRQMCNNDYV